nr:MAG TPA: minor structural protein [Caudoviricetes sp.]
MKEFLESLEIGEGKEKLSQEIIKSILAKNGEIVKVENKKIEDKKDEEIKNCKSTIDSLNEQLKNIPDSKELDALKQEVADFKEKEAKRIADEKEAKEKSIRDERTNAFFNDIKFASESAKAGVIAKFNEKNFNYDEESKKFLGATEWLNDLKEKDSGAFLSDVANPKFTTTPTAPTNDSSMDKILHAMGLDEEKK